MTRRSLGERVGTEKAPSPPASARIHVLEDDLTPGSFQLLASLEGRSLDDVGPGEGEASDEFDDEAAEEDEEFGEDEFEDADADELGDDFDEDDEFESDDELEEDDEDDDFDDDEGFDADEDLDAGEASDE